MEFIAYRSQLKSVSQKLNMLERRATQLERTDFARKTARAQMKLCKERKKGTSGGGVERVWV